MSNIFKQLRWVQYNDLKNPVFPYRFFNLRIEINTQISMINMKQEYGRLVPKPLYASILVAMMKIFRNVQNDNKQLRTQWMLIVFSWGNDINQHLPYKYHCQSEMILTDHCPFIAHLFHFML